MQPTIGDPIVVTAYGTPASERFWSKVDQSNSSSCWPWLAARTPAGYGTFWLDGRTQRAHRIAWLLTHAGEEIPAGYVVRHRCDNPPCCNPDHLALGTNRDNARDRVARKRSAFGDRNGSRLYPERLVRGPANHQWREGGCRNGHAAERRYVSASGERICTDCATARRRRIRAKEGRRAS